MICSTEKSDGWLFRDTIKSSEPVLCAEHSCLNNSGRRETICGVKSWPSPQERRVEIFFYLQEQCDAEKLKELESESKLRERDWE